MGDLRELGGKVSLDVTDWKTGIAELNRATRVIESGFRAAAAGMDDWAKSADGLEKRIESLTKEMELQEKKVGLLRKEYERIAEEKGKDSRAAQELLIKLNKENEVLGKHQVELAKTKTKLEEMGKESKDAGRGAGELADKEDQARTATGRLKDALDGLKAKLGTLGNDFRNLGDKVLKGLVVGIAGIVAAVAGLTVGIGKLLSKTIQPASDLSETVSKIGIVFGDQSDKVLKFGENASESLGMSANAALAAAGVYGNLFRSMGMTERASADMSIGLVQLAGDLASFNNMNPEEVLDKLRAGLTGEAEPLKSLGVNINEALIKERALELGLWNGKDALDASAKAQAAYSLIMEQTSLAQGDFARTSGGLANQQRILAAKLENLKAKIGQALLPLITKIVTKFQEWLSNPKIQKGIDDLIEGFRTIADTIGRVMEKLLSGDIAGALSEIFPKETVKQIIEFGKALKEVIVNVIIPFVKKHAEGIKAAIVGPSETIPVQGGRPVLGTWQNVFFCEFDGPRASRRIDVTGVW